MLEARAQIVALPLLLGFAFAVSGATQPPRFTEEREAAALFFVNKHCPELAPLLSELRKNNPAQYQIRIREIFRVTEMLAEIEDERRQQLEVKIWKAENRALIIVAKIAVAKDDDKAPLQTSLAEAAKQLVELDIQVLEMQAAQLGHDLNQTKEQLNRLRANVEQSARSRFESLLDRAKKK